MSHSDFECPTCGEEVSPNASACRNCGAQKVDGRWADSSSYDGIDLPDDEFDYDDFVAREFGTGQPKKTGKDFFWWIVAVVLLIALLVMSLPLLNVLMFRSDH
tara:strand:- start:650 stop:958 length:309 start_codon:yes stop_codon:yes gene_type:complete